MEFDIKLSTSLTMQLNLSILNKITNAAAVAVIEFILTYSLSQMIIKELLSIKTRNFVFL